MYMMRILPRLLLLRYQIYPSEANRNLNLYMMIKSEKYGTHRRRNGIFP